MVMTHIPMLSVPIEIDDQDVMRISGTRVTLDSLIAYYLQGESPEALHQGFPTVPLADIYAVIAYYLTHQTELDAYFARRRAESARKRQQIEAEYTSETRELHARWRAQLDHEGESD